MDEYRCICGKFFEKANSLNAHYSHCHVKRNGEFKRVSKKGKMQGWTDELESKRSEMSKKGWNTFIESGVKRPPVSEETKQKISKAVKGKTGGPREGSNRWRKCITVQDGKEVSLDSSYELRFVKVLDFCKIKWVKNYKRFLFVYKGEKRIYIPDFYLPEYDLWVEIKGWEKEIDKYKWSSFPYNLEVVRKNDLEYFEKVL